MHYLQIKIVWIQERNTFAWRQIGQGSAWIRQVEPFQCNKFITNNIRFHKSRQYIFASSSLYELSCNNLSYRLLNPSIVKSVIYIIENHIMLLQQSRPINDKYAIIDSQLLGKGSTGNVYLGFLLNSPQMKVAVKAINLKEIDNEVTRYLLSCQIAALSNLGKIENTAHENIVRLLDVVIHENYIYLVTQLLEGGTLAQYLKRSANGLQQDEAMLIFRQILQAYKEIRNKGVIHRDLKPDNILFKTKPQISKRIAIIDFGYCEMNQIPNKPQMYYNVGSPKYMAPEAYMDNLYSQKSDIWALGVILYEMLVGKTCDQGLKMQTYLQMIRKNGIPLPTHISPFFKQIISKMLHYNHQARFDCLQVLKDLQNYQASIQSFASSKKSSQFTESVPSNDFFSLRSNKNNPTFKSAVMGPTPLHLFQSQIQPKIIIHQPPNIKPQQSMQNPNSDKRFIKSNSARNVNNLITFNSANPNPSPSPNILEKLQNTNALVRNRVEVKPMHNASQRFQHVDSSFPNNNKIHFKMIPANNTYNHSINSSNQMIPQHNLHPREQRLLSNIQADQNSIKILIKNPRMDRAYHTINNQTMVSIEKDRIFHSPQRKQFGSNTKVHFFTQKKLRHNNQELRGRHVIDGRHLNGQIRRQIHTAPMFGMAHH